jgi:hypothetical protein
MSTLQGHPSNNSWASWEAELTEKLKFLRDKRPKPWTINHSTRTITSSLASADTAVETIGLQDRDQSDQLELKESYIFNPHICERVSRGEEDDAIFSKFEPSKCRLRLHTDLLKPGEDYNDGKAMFLTDPPIGIVFMRVTYQGPTADDETTEACTNVIAGGRGATARDVLQMAYAFSMMPEIVKGKGPAVIKEILIDARDAIWVTTAEKLKVEKEGQLTVPNLSERGLKSMVGVGGG